MLLSECSSEGKVAYLIKPILLVLQTIVTILHIALISK